MPPRVSVVLATHNEPRLLDLALCGYACQSVVDFEILVADDGATPETAEIVELYTRVSAAPVVHVPQPDQGFRRAEAINRAALRSRAPYLILTDADRVPAPGLVEEHLEARRPGRYVIGGAAALRRSYAERLSRERVRTGEFQRQVGFGARARARLQHAGGRMRALANPRFLPEAPGSSLSLERDAFFRVNGMDHRFQNRALEDADLRRRLQLAGLRPTGLYHRARTFQLPSPPRGSRALRELPSATPEDLRPEAPIGLREVSGP